MNLLNRMERFIKRPVIARMIETNETYLSALSKRREVTPDMEVRLRDVLRQVIKQLENLLEEK